MGSVFYKFRLVYIFQCEAAYKVVSTNANWLRKTIRLSHASMLIRDARLTFHNYYSFPIRWFAD
jgi:hypothetical protein